MDMQSARPRQQLLELTYRKKSIMRLINTAVTLILIVTTNLVYSGENSFNQKLVGTQITTSVNQFELQDDFLEGMLNAAYPLMNIAKVKNVVRLSYTGSLKKYYPELWTFGVTFNLYLWDQNGIALPPIYGKTLEIEFGSQTTGDYNDISILSVPLNAHRVIMDIINVAIPTDFNGTIPNDVELELEMQVERYFDIDQTPSYITANYNSTDNTIDFSWDGLAEEFDVEWAFLSTDVIGAASLPTLPGDVDSKRYTRVTVNKNHYQINAPTDNVRTYYRVRKIGRFGSQYKNRRFGAWSNTPSTLSDLTNFSPDKNWQYQASYAEDGKVKEVLSFADGSLKSRQSITLLNTDQTAIIAESFYDYEGRSVIQTLPAPNSERSHNLKFYEDYTLNQNGTILSKSDYDNDGTAACSVSSYQLGNGNGAGNYYSSNQSVAFKNTGLNKYIPDANGYPFSRTKYNRDGRVSMQSGLGQEHRMGGGHETKFQDAVPDQVKLDRMFGSEVGHASQYRLKTTTDANGQQSLSYTNSSGKVIATSLVGGARGGIDKLTNNQQGQLTTDFNSFNEYSATNEAYFMYRNYLVEVANEPFAFTYTISPEAYQDACQNNNACKYDVIIEIFDNCDDRVFDDTDIVLHKKFIFFDGVFYDNANVTFGTALTFTVTFPKVGTYKIRKRLTIHQDEIDRNNPNSYLAVFETNQPCGFGDLSMFQTSLTDNIDYSICDDCSTATNGVCDLTVEPNCHVLLNNFKLDLSPGGQYFDNRTAGSNATASNDWLIAHAIPNDAANAAWANLSRSDGTFPTSWDEVRLTWESEWADYLVRYHPEIDHYQWCSDFPNLIIWEAELNTITTYSQAIAAGFVPVDMIPHYGSAADGDIEVEGLFGADPYFNEYNGDFFNSQVTFDMRSYLKDMDGNAAPNIINVSTYPADLPSAWDYAIYLVKYNFIENGNNCFDIGANVLSEECKDLIWRTFKYLYLQKRNEFVNAKKRSQVFSLCDGSIPPDFITDAIGACNPVYGVGFKIHVPDIYEILSPITGATDPTSVAVQLNAFGQSLQDQYGLCTADPNVTPASGFLNNIELIDNNNVGDCNGYTSSCFGTGLIEGWGVESQSPDYYSALSLNIPKNTYPAIGILGYLDYNEVIYNQLSTRLVQGVTYTLTFDVRKDFLTTNPDNQLEDIIYVAFTNTLGFNGSSGATDPDKYEIELEEISRSWNTVTFSFRANGNYNYMYLASKMNANSTEVATYVFISKIQLTESCFVETNCICSELELYYEVYTSDSGADSTQFDSDMAYNYNQTYNTSITPATINEWRNNCSQLNVPVTASSDIIPEAIAPCLDVQVLPCGHLATQIANYYGDYFYTNAIDEAVNKFIAEYKATCFGNVVPGNNFGEDFTVTYKDQEYQYTLYYYDQAGNLVKTVPPEGVHTLSQPETDMVKAHRVSPNNPATPFVKTNHLMQTEYEYNSLNQVVRQSIPDAKSIAEWDVQQGTITPGNLKDIYYVNNHIAYACDHLGNILKTIDSGVVWTNVYSNSTREWNALHFIDEDNGVVVANSGRIATTNDGGTTWSDLSYGSNHIKSINVLTTNGNAGYVIAGFGGSIAYSSDGGTSWTGVSGIPSTVQFWGVDITSLGKVIAVGNYSTCYLIEDITGASIVVDGSTGLGTSLFLRAVDFVDESHGYAVGKIGTNEAAVFATIDGGLSWNNVSPNPIVVSALHDVYFTGQLTGYTVGTAGVILSTANGGTNWILEDALGSGGSLNSIARIDNGSVTIVGSSGEILSALVGNYSNKFWYDKVGRLVASQNSRQSSQVIPAYSYSKYDSQGRIVEVGQLATELALSKEIINNPNYPDNWTQSTYSEITNTVYDVPYTTATNAYFGVDGQDNLRSKVSTVSYQALSDDDNYQFATHYSYDEHGNAKTVIQENKLMGSNQRIRMEYNYDLISGNVNQVTYQKGKCDQFYHKYKYDADNRITKTLTSSNGIDWDKDAKYYYYLHGPLGRMELGDQKVQGLDYAYTIQGWLKGINGNTLDITKDIGADGGSTGDYYANNTDIHANISKDAFGFTLQYYDSDYQSISASANNYLSDINQLQNTTITGANLFNGNIKTMATALMDKHNVPMDVMATSYRYDQLNRLKKMEAFSGADYATCSLNSNEYFTELEYDNNGNILVLRRNGNRVNPTMDNLSYTYISGTNKLSHVDDAVASIYNTDIDDQNAFNYTYDNIGNLIQDNAEEIANIAWNAYGKISKILRPTSSTRDELEFRYDAGGNRTMKIVKPRVNGVTSAPENWVATYYARDAQGNVMATYGGVFEEHESDLVVTSEVTILESKAVVGKQTLHTMRLALNGIELHNGFIIEKSTTNATAQSLSTAINSHIGIIDFTAVAINNKVIITSNDPNASSLVGATPVNVISHDPIVIGAIPVALYGSAAEFEEVITLQDHTLYGTSRLGVKNQDFVVDQNNGFATGIVSLEGDNQINGQGLIQLFVDGIPISHPVPWEGVEITTHQLVQSIYNYVSSPDFVAYIDPMSDGSHIVIRALEEGQVFSVGTITGNSYGYPASNTFTTPLEGYFKVNTIQNLEINNNEQIAIYGNNRGSKTYELSNHLGNVLSTVSDKKEGVDVSGNTIVDFYQGDVRSAQHYYAFGSLMEHVDAFDDGYRYGFNGYEHDLECKNSSDVYEAGGRSIYDGRLGRFVSRDPRESEYSWQSPYAFFKNSPASVVDYKGMGGDEESRKLLDIGGVKGNVMTTIGSDNNGIGVDLNSLIDLYKSKKGSFSLKNYSIIQGVVLGTKHGVLGGSFEGIARTDLDLSLSGKSGRGFGLGYNLTARRNTGEFKMHNNVTKAISLSYITANKNLFFAKWTNDSGLLGPYESDWGITNVLTLGFVNPKQGWSLTFNEEMITGGFRVENNNSPGGVFNNNGTYDDVSSFPGAFRNYTSMTFSNRVSTTLFQVTAGYESNWQGAKIQSFAHGVMFPMFDGSDGIPEFDGWDLFRPTSIYLQLKVTFLLNKVN